MFAFLKRLLAAAVVLPLLLLAGAPNVFAQPAQNDEAKALWPEEEPAGQAAQAVPHAAPSVSEPALPDAKPQAPLPPAEQPAVKPEKTALSAKARKTAARAKSRKRPKRKKSIVIDYAPAPLPKPVEERPRPAAKAKPSKTDPIDYLAFGVIPERQPEYYAKFIGTATYEGVIDIKAQRDGQFVLTISSGEWVVKDDMLGFISSPEMSAIMSLTPRDERLSAAQRWKQVYGADVIKADRPCLVTAVYRPDRSMVRKGDLLFSLAEEAYVIAETEGEGAHTLSPGMRAQLRQQNVPNSPVIPAILQELFPAQGAEPQDPLEKELGKKPDMPKYFLRLQVPQRAMPYVGLGKNYDGYIVKQDAPPGPVLPKRSIFPKDGKSYLMTLKEVSVAVETEKGVQLNEAPWPGTVYVFPESLANYAVKTSTAPKQAASAKAELKAAPKKVAPKKKPLRKKPAKRHVMTPLVPAEGGAAVSSGTAVSPDLQDKTLPAGGPALNTKEEASLPGELSTASLSTPKLRAAKTRAARKSALKKRPAKSLVNKRKPKKQTAPPEFPAEPGLPGLPREETIPGLAPAGQGAVPPQAEQETKTGVK
ncbi:MAG TPA: hypothetical protein PLL10_01065 [Elusimicrobiales bacterium]|nr:hypothetical protein [Elusimicrobiales bacterium]